MIIRASTALIGYLAAAFGTTSAVAEMPNQDEAEIRALLESKYSRQNACDFSYLGTYATDGATEYLPNYVAPQLKDSQQSVAALRSLCAAGGRTNLDITVQGVDILGGDTAITYGIGHYYRVEPDGRRTYESDFNWTDVLVKTNAGWRVRHTHVGPIIPGMPTVPPSRPEE